MKMIKFQALFELPSPTIDTFDTEIHGLSYSDAFSLGKKAEKLGNQNGFTPYEIGRFDVLHHGWECDEYAWVVIDTDGVRHLFMTNHGASYEAQAEDLIGLIDSYKKVIKETEEALVLLEG